MRPRTIVLVLVLIGIAALGAYVARPYLREGRAGSTEGAAKGTYQCSMHPQIVQDHPGTCPICQMTLQRADEPAAAAEPPTSAARAPLFYRHPMRPDVTSPTPAKDEMGMDYVAVYPDEVGAPALSLIHI